MTSLYCNVPKYFFPHVKVAIAPISHNIKTLKPTGVFNFVVDSVQHGKNVTMAIIDRCQAHLRLLRQKLWPRIHSGP